MSFVAEAAAGSRRKGYRSGGEGTWGGGEGIWGGAREKVLSRQPSRATEDPDREQRDPNHNNDNEKKKSDGHFSKKETKSVQDHLLRPNWKRQGTTGAIRAWWPTTQGTL